MATRCPAMLSTTLPRSSTWIPVFFRMAAISGGLVGVVIVVAQHGDDGHADVLQLRDQRLGFERFAGA